MRESIAKAKFMAKADTLGTLANTMKDSGKGGSKRAMASGKASMGTLTLASGSKISLTALASMFGEIKICTRASGRRA